MERGGEPVLQSSASEVRTSRHRCRRPPHAAFAASLADWLPKPSVLMPMHRVVVSRPVASREAASRPNPLRLLTWLTTTTTTTTTATTTTPMTWPERGASHFLTVCGLLNVPHFSCCIYDCLAHDVTIYESPHSKHGDAPSSCMVAFFSPVFSPRGCRGSPHTLLRTRAVAETVLVRMAAVTAEGSLQREALKRNPHIDIRHDHVIEKIYRRHRRSVLVDLFTDYLCKQVT